MPYVTICFETWRAIKNMSIHITCFQSGITYLTLLTAAEWVRVAFLLSMLTISAQGQFFGIKSNKDYNQMER